MPFRLPDAEPELPFRDAPFCDAPLREGLVPADVVRLADVERLAEVVRRFWLAPPLRAVDRFVVFVLGSESEVVVFRRVAGLDFLVVAIGFPHPEACSTCLPRLPRGSPFLTAGRAPR